MLVMLSGGRDSVCLAHRLRWPAMHMNYGLRGPESDADEAFCRELCEQLGIALTVVRPGSAPSGNLQAWARRERYEAAERLTEGEIAVAHTASDQAETVLYRLLTSGTVRGMDARRGRIVRPLLSWSRSDVTAYCVEHGLSWREDASNADDRFARNRIRALLASFPAGEVAVLRALEKIDEDEGLLASLVRPTSSVAELRALPPALLRRTLASMAGRPVDPARALRGADLGGGLRSVVEHGNLRFDRDGPLRVQDGAVLTVPGHIGWGEGVLSAEMDANVTGGLDPASLSDPLEVRTWQHGDRMRPAGMNGHSKSLQDLFTDRKVPRETRHRLPVVLSDGEIVWIPGVASEAHRTDRAPAVRFAFELVSA